MPAMTSLPAWHALQRLAADRPVSPADDEDRFAGLAVAAPGMLIDFSRQPVDGAIVSALLDLGDQAELSARREQLFAGAPLNSTEQRPALHTALRAPAGERPAFARDVVTQTLDRLSTFANAVRTAAYRGYSGRAITDIVHIGIGGSHLGPELCVEAIGDQTLRCHFVANVDGQAITAALAQCQPETTLFIIVSKSFSTLETQVNANTARSWFLERVADPDVINRHFIAITANVDRAREFGMTTTNIYPLWDWVGGRFSLWSAVGMPILLTAGTAAFAELLQGAHAMDQHFRSAPPSRNAPLLMALIGLWNYGFLGATSQAILPYDQRLRLLPSYLQQLEMESNGKSVQLDGTPVPVTTMPVVWGGEGTNGQHAFHQLLHQGTSQFAADFILVGRPGHALRDHHRWLLANGLAQGQAMQLGQNDPDPHRYVPGKRASTTIVLDALTPFSLGALLALYEHKVFCQGVLWNINSFDQWGVELGKRLALPIFEQLAGYPADNQDSSTQGLLAHLRSLHDQ